MSEPRSLPPRPDLRHLRDEAKRRRKAGEFPSIALAQLGIAREYGFRSWPRLKFHVEARTLDAAARAQRSSPRRRPPTSGARGHCSTPTPRSPATTWRVPARPVRPTRCRVGWRHGRPR